MSFIHSEDEFLRQMRQLLVEVLKEAGLMGPQKALTYAPDQLLREDQVAELLRCSVRCLQTWRNQTRKGPHWVKLQGSLVRYRYSDVARFIDDPDRANKSEK